MVQRHLAACRLGGFPAGLPRGGEQRAGKSEPRAVRAEDAAAITSRWPARSTSNTARSIIRATTRARRWWTFISSRASGEVTGWTYMLVFEDGDWKVDHGEPIPGWPAGQRLGGSACKRLDRPQAAVVPDVKRALRFGFARLTRFFVVRCACCAGRARGRALSWNHSSHR